MEILGAIFVVLLALAFNPLVWVIIIVILIVRHNRKTGGKSSLLYSQEVINAGRPANLAQTTPNPPVIEDTSATLLDDMARNAHDPVERDTLERAAYSLRHNLHYLISRAAYRKSLNATTTKTIASQAPANAAPVPAAPPTPPKPAGPPPVPLSERGLKALQNINILLYLGAFFVVIAAGIFVGSTYQSITPGGQVFIMALFTAAFYLTGIGLYRFTDKIKPAGVTFTAIGLLLAPLVGVAAQSLLFAGKNVGPLWLVTTAVMLIMQVTAFLLIRKTYIAYFAALTTISLFQSITATSNASLYWYGWVMLGTSMLYAVAAKYISDKQVSQPLTVTAQIFVPISVLLAFIGLQRFGLWNVGVQLILTAAFYLMCAALEDFDASDASQRYLWLAVGIFPLGLGLTLLERRVPVLAVVAILAVIATTYVMAEKFALHERHQIIYEVVSAVLMVLIPILVIDRGATLGWILIGCTLFHAIHYLLTRKALSYGLFLISLTITPLFIAQTIFQPQLSVEHQSLIFSIMGVIGAVITVQARQLAQHPRLTVLTRGFVSFWATWAVFGALVGTSTYWPALLAVIGGAVALYLALTGPRAFLVGTAIAWNVAVIALGLRSGWSGSWIALGISVVAVTLYVLKWLPQFAKDRDSVLLLTFVNLSLAYGWAGFATGIPSKAMMLGIGVVMAGLGWREKSAPVFSLGALAVYIATGWLGLQLQLDVAWISLMIFGVALIIYLTKHFTQWLAKESQSMAVLYSIGLTLTYLVGFSDTKLSLLVVMALPVIMVFALSFLEDERIASAIAFIALLGWSLQLARVTNLWISPTLLVTALALYGFGSVTTGDRAKLARWSGVIGSYVTLMTNSANSLPTWLPVLQNYTAGSLSMAESFKLENRFAKYASSVVIWLTTLQAYNVAHITNSQAYMQTTAVYFGALAYRQWQRGEKQAQDIMTATALGFATVPLAFQALGDQTGGYVLGILGLGIAILLFGLATHYALVRTWGIATLVIITLYKTAGAILNLPAWVWFGTIGLCILGGAIYLLSRRPHE